MTNSFASSESIFLSAIEHYSYCPRQWALIHLEQQYAENVHTMRGGAAHRLVDDHSIKQEKHIRIERSLPLYSLKYNLVGKADVVEFHSDGAIYPVEYKHGKNAQRCTMNYNSRRRLFALRKCWAGPCRWEPFTMSPPGNGGKLRLMRLYAQSFWKYWR